MINYVDNQENTDFEKVLDFIQQECLNNKITSYNVVAEGAFGGRMDQTLSNMHILSKYSNLYPSRRIILIDKNSLMIMLFEGSNVVNLPMNLISKKGCGFFPVSERVEHI